MTVGALSAHLVRAAGATLAYLDRTDPSTRPDGELLTPVTYFHAAIDSPIHERIKEVSAAADAGIQEGDIITQVNGQKVGTTEEFGKLVGKAKKGDFLKAAECHEKHFMENVSYSTTYSSTATSVDQKSALLAGRLFEEAI